MNVLAQVQRQRVRFSPEDKKHIDQYRNFVVKTQMGCSWLPVRIRMALSKYS